MPLETPNNCWPANLAKFGDGLAESAQFQTLVGAADEVEAAAKIFGKRLTESKAGRTWTRDELAELRAYAMVYGDPDNPFGYHLANNAHYESHGLVIVAVGRLVPETDLIDPNENATGLTDVHDREWQNIVGTIITQMLAWLAENAGPYPIPAVEVVDDHETRAENARQQGTWQYSEVAFRYGVTG